MSLPKNKYIGIKINYTFVEKAPFTHSTHTKTETNTADKNNNYDSKYNIPE